MFIFFKSEAVGFENLNVMSAESEKITGVQTLLIAGVSREVLARLKDKGASMVPPVQRNPLILWVLSEYAAGRLVPDDASADADLSHRVVVPATDGDQGERRAA